MGTFTGTLDLSVNNNSPTMGTFSGSGSATRTLNMGNGTWTITGSGTCWQNSTTTGFTFNANSSTIIFNTTAAGFTMQGGALTYNNVTVTATQQFTIGAASNTFNNLTITPTNGNTWIVNASQTITGTLTITGTDTATTPGRVIVTPATIPGTSATYRTITATSVSLKNVDFLNINAAGSIPWRGISLGNAGRNTNITFTPAVTKYWVGNGGNNNLFSHYADTSGGVPGKYTPLPQDSLIFDAKSITAANQTISIAVLRYAGKDVNFTGVRFTPVLNIGNSNAGILGSLTLASGMTTNLTSTATLTFMGESSHTLTTNGVPMRFNLQFTGDLSTYTLQDNLTMTSINTLTATFGSFNANNFNVTTGIFNGSSTGVRTLSLGSGTWTLLGTGTVWDTGTTTGLTLNKSTSTISIAETDGAGKIFSGGGLTYNNLTITGGGTGDITFGNNNNTFNNLTVNNPKTLKFPAGGTLTCANFTANGVSGSLIYMRSSINGYAWKLTVLSGYSTSFIDLQDSDASSTTII